MFFLDNTALDCTNENLLAIVGIIKGFYTLIQIGIPIMLLLFGTIDLGKAVMAGDEKEIKGATKTLTKRAIAAVAVFLLVFIVRLITGYIGGTVSGAGDWDQCWSNNFSSGGTGITKPSEGHDGLSE